MWKYFDFLNKFELLEHSEYDRELAHDWVQPWHHLWSYIQATTCSSMRSPELLHTRIIAKYQTYHVNCKLKISSINLWIGDQSQNWIQNPAFWLVSHPQNHGGNFKLIGHVTNLIYCKDSSYIPLFCQRATTGATRNKVFVRTLPRASRLISV